MRAAVAAVVPVVDLGQHGELAAQCLKRREVAGKRSLHPLLRRKEGIADHAKGIRDADETLRSRRLGGVGKSLQPGERDSDSCCPEEMAAIEKPVLGSDVGHGTSSS